jgi:hypothetical protein
VPRRDVFTAAARQGAKTCLLHDRPVLGGNSSSEVRVTPHGAAAFHAYARETGILSELLIEERARNHETIFENGWTNSVWDLVLYDAAQTAPNLMLRLNTAVVAVEFAGAGRVTGAPLPDARFGYLHRPACAPERRITAVVARVANAETELVVQAELFIDCTGDADIAHLAGASYRKTPKDKMLGVTSVFNASGVDKQKFLHALILRLKIELQSKLRH